LPAAGTDALLSDDGASGLLRRAGKTTCKPVEQE